jgi:predicted secreted protein
LFQPSFARKTKLWEANKMASSSVLIALLVNLASSPAPQANLEPVAAESPATPTKEKIICVVTQVTGSLARTRRVCQSKDMWAKQGESFQDQWKALQGTHGHTNEEMMLKKWSPILPR